MRSASRCWGDYHFLWRWTRRRGAGGSATRSACRVTRTSSEKHTPNDTWGAYRLISRLDTTTRAFEVWGVEDSRHHRRFAMKLMQPQWSGNRHWVRSLRQEYFVGHQLKHEQVIETRDFDVKDGLAYLVMELFPEPNLKQWMREVDVCKVPFLSHIVETASESLQYLHSQGWVHRDIKSDNFLVGGGRVGQTD